MSIIQRIKNVYGDLTETNSKEWSKRKYEFYLLFSELTDEELPWNHKLWIERIEPVIDKIILQSPEYKNTGVRVLEYQKQANSEYYKELKLGRIRWNPESHKKWTIKKDSEIKFKHLELWTPIWTKCEKSNSAPDVFITICNEDDLVSERHLQFNVFTVLAIATDLNFDNSNIITELSEKLNAKKTVKNIRKWTEGKSDKNKNWKFYNWIQDTFSNGIYKGKNLHSFNFEEIEFEPYWETVNEKNNAERTTKDKKHRTDLQPESSSDSGKSAK
ncbi:MAG: hypothetical protein ABJG68_00165 [Crocinitomicaceae bacterium]